MSLRTSINKKAFQFNFEARTSRGLMKERISWFIKIWDDQRPEIFGLGECAPLEGLSKETPEQIDALLNEWQAKVNSLSIELPVAVDRLKSLHEFLFINKVLPHVSALIFGVETAFLDLINGGSRLIFHNGFYTGSPIPINGLVWIGGLDYMLQQIDIKIKDGFRCIKIKVGRLNFEKECDILQYIRRKYYREDIVVRLDANGAFKPEEAKFKLMDISRFGVHSIEQPLRPGAIEMRQLCIDSPIPIALDEELIGVDTLTDRRELLQRIKPAFIVLKPSLHGGLLSCEEWIQLAEQQQIGWWMTSALESSIGLNAIAQFTMEYPIKLPQGLGTGTIYENNFESPLQVEKGTLFYNNQINWDLISIFPSPLEPETK
jgi:o-succinylbenzoate synthase